MRDMRMDHLAQRVVSYSVRLQPGEHILIEAWDGAEEMAEAFVLVAGKAGGYPHLSLKNKRLERSWLLETTEQGLEAWANYECERMSRMQAYIAIRRQDNAMEWADIPDEKMQLYNLYQGKINKLRMPIKWCVLRYPSPSMAQTAGMSTEAFEDFYFRACSINYEKLNEIASVLNGLCHRTDRVRILAPDTDLTFSIKDCCQEQSLCGIWNIPCGETGMQIVQGSANGYIHYNIPSNYQGKTYTDLRLVLKDGVVVEATSSDTAAMNAVLNTDEGARRIGEFAIGFNPMMDRPILDTLFDEKMAMTLHFTPGNSPNNPSAIHWDMVQSHAPEMGGGEIWFDDVLIRKNGLFMPQELQCMNPDPLKEALMED